MGIVVAEQLELAAEIRAAERVEQSFNRRQRQKGLPEHQIVPLMDQRNEIQAKDAGGDASVGLRAALARPRAKCPWATVS